MAEIRPPARMTETALAEAALTYLSRYASSSGNLRRVLRRKVFRSARHWGDDPAPLMQAIEALVARHVETGAVNDALYAENQVRKLRRRGGSANAILQRLAAKGVPPDIAVEATGGDLATEADLTAAIQFARRRRLGPFRPADRPDERTENRQRDMAALGRAGFPYDLAASVIDAQDAEALVGPSGFAFLK